MKSEHLIKKPAAIPPIFFRIKADLDTRLGRVLKAHRRERNDLAREALDREVARLEAMAAPIDAATQKIVADAQRLGVDVRAVLREATKQHVAGL